MAYLIIDGSTNEIIANMANTLAHEVAHVMGIEEEMYDNPNYPSHDNTNPVCIMRAASAYDEEYLYNLVINGSNSNGFCEVCKGILNDCIDMVFFDEHIPPPQEA